MAVVALTRTPTQIDSGSTAALTVLNSGTVNVKLAPSGHVLTPGETANVFTYGNPLLAQTTRAGASGQVTTSTYTKPADPGLVQTGPATSGLPATIVSRTTAYTASAGDAVLATTTTAGFTVTLPAAPAVGALVTVKKVSSDGNTLTIAPSGGGTIDGDPTATTVTKGGGAVFEHVGGNVWQVTAVTLTTGPAGPTGPAGAAGPTGPAGPGGAAVFSGAKVYRLTGQSVPATTATNLTWDAEEYDTDALHSTTTNTDRLTIPTSGYWLLTYAFGATASNASTVRFFGQIIKVAGSALVRGSRAEAAVVNPGQTTLSCSVPVLCTAGDEFAVQAFSGYAFTTDPAVSMFAATKIGA
ncbi:MAG: hypothetical protein JWO69_1996 [Thermoleophilia bacterium]|nr:hypothetical protein [Thermoleophilia bacterium]